MIDPTNVASATDPSTAYDGGAARPILTVVASSGSLSTSAATAIAAAPGLRTKIIGLNIVCTAWAAEGTLQLRDGAGGSGIFVIARFPTPGVGARVAFDIGGKMFCQSSVNTLVEIFYNVASGTFTYNIIYYQAP